MSDAVAESQGMISHFCGTAVAIAALTATLLGMNGAEVPLVVATGVLAAVICTFWASSYLWDKLVAADERLDAGATPGSETEPAPLGRAITAGAQLAITIQGVVLGLIFSLSDQGDVTVTSKVAVIALGAGVIFGILLITVSGDSIHGPSTHAFVILLFYLTLWGLAYGLISIVSVVVLS
ncbi:hypothetical protein [Streptomyces sp. NBC_00887]|uniref:hypothetical protein n=1 Tax=Streptomyces sp. NBC_00887 TaxID=2975859 RepID=UPI00386D16EC|nr:hypothetical protein OG844_30035 [Streptomyces sp. NBC_00887]